MDRVIRKIAHIAIFSFLLTFSAGLILAQSLTTGGISGTVTDQSGAAVPGASVTLKNLDSGQTVTATANNEGAFTFSLLPPNRFIVQAKSAGLNTDEQQIVVQVGQTANLNLVAKVQATQEVIEVSSTAEALQTENADLTQTFTAQQVLALPTPGGDITTVAFTVPGVVMSLGGGYGNFSSHGLPAVSNLFTINGNDYNDAYLNLNNSGASNLLLGQTEIAEASVTQNGYSVQYGRQAGAQANYVTKSGSNAFHGDLLFNFNSDIMNANDFFNNLQGTARPYSVSRQWGADIGGPVFKNRLFFYSDSEGLYYSLPTSGVVNIPSPQLQNYTLAHISAAQTPLYQQAFNIYNSLKGAVPVTNGSGQLQDGNNQLGCGDLTGTAALSGGTFGTNVPCMYAYRTNGLNTNKEWLETHRVDWNITDKQKLFVRFKGDHGFQPTGTNLLNSGLDEQSIQPQYEGQINHTWTITPTMVNNAIASVLWYSAYFGPASVSKSQAIFPTYFSFATGNAGGDNGATGLYAQGVNWPTFPQGRDVGQLQLVDDVSKIAGNHALKFGVNFRKNRVTDFGNQSGTIGSYAFNSLADFANGQLSGVLLSDGKTDATASSYNQKFSPLTAAHLRLYNVGFYAQDEWSVRPNLKITAGIRLDRTANPLCVDKCFSNLNVPFDSAAFQMGASIPYNQSIRTGLSHAYYNVDNIVPDPRASFVWTPGSSNGSTVLRGGVGLFSDLFPAFIVSNIFNNAPFPYNAQITSGAVNLANDPNSAAAAAQAQFNAFKNGFFNGDTLSQLAAATGGAFSPLNYYSIPNKFLTPEYLEWSFEIEHRFGQKDVLTVTYSGNHGYNLLMTNNFGNAAINGTITGPFANFPSTAPDPRFGTIFQYNNDGYSNYDGLTVAFRHTLTKGLQFDAAYTWSHALDTLSNAGAGEPYSFCSGCSLGTMANPNVAANYGSSDYDVRHNFVAELTYDTPWKFTNRILANVLGNWTVGGKFFARTGTPFSVIDSSLAGAISPTNLNGITLLANSTVPSVNTSCGSSAVNTPCLSTSQFTAAGTETTFGNLGRNAFTGPNYFDIDASLFKNITIREGLRFQFGASAYNLMNHPHFQNPVADVSAPGFGSIQATAVQPTSPYGSFQGSAVSGRVLVVSGRFNF